LQETLLMSDAALLERGPSEEFPAHLEFPEALFPCGSNGVGPRLVALFQAWQGGASPYCLSDRVRAIAEALIRLRSGSFSKMSRIDAVKPSTREELFRRVQAALIFVRENYATNIDVYMVARHAGMAPHHLHRTFRAIHGLTLHQQIVQLRLDEAKRLLEGTDLPISRICSRVGYSSLPSFTNLFRSRFGGPPSAVRRSPRME
jgi:AraC family transcriptional regulator